MARSFQTFTVETEPRPTGSGKSVTVEQWTSGIYVTDNTTGQRSFVTATALTMLARKWQVADPNTDTYLD